jgi:hypothetical protein
MMAVPVDTSSMNNESFRGAEGLPAFKAELERFLREMRAAAVELGFDTAICEDGCATLTARAHLDALLMHAWTFGRVATTAGGLRELDGDQES